MEGKCHLSHGFNIPVSKIENWTFVDRNESSTLPDFNMRVVVELHSGFRLYATRFNRVCFVNLLGEPRAFGVHSVRRWKYVPVNGALTDKRLLDQIRKVQK